MRFCASRIAIGFFALVVSARAAGGLDAGKVQEIDRLVAGLMAQRKVPGVSVAVATSNQLCWSKGFGMADLENSVPARASTVYRIASISKSITAVAVMQLVEKGRLNLEAPIRQYVPAFPEKPWPITCRQLLSQQSGVRHYRDASETGSTRHYWNLADALSLFKNDPLVFTPGSRFGYSSYGYLLLGLAVERASGKRFIPYLNENIFKPAGMGHTRADDVFEVIPNRARGYRRTRAGEIQNCVLMDSSYKIPGGGLLSTVGDLAQFATALNRGALVRTGSAKALFTRQRLTTGRLTNYGLGWYIRERDGMLLAYHNGAQPGASTILLLMPSSQVAVAMLANLENVDLLPAAVQIATIAAHSGIIASK
jgi:CubicO group peptidase (beta-lactamase class C family)